MAKPFWMVLFLIVLLAGFSLVPFVHANPRLAGSFWAASGALLLFLGLLHRQVIRRGRVLRYEVLPRPVHYVQLAMHSSIYAYWGWYWREVYHYIPLILAQIIFVYALDMLVCWSRRDKWILGFGPFPIVLSTNLFLWFKDDWFFLQFLLIATGVLCKEFVTWMRDGRRTHIFNPSAIALAIFSAGLILTHTTQISWAEEVAVTLGRPPNIYLEIFVLGLIVQALFSVTLVTLSAAAMLYLLNVAYTGTTGVYYFVDSNIPAAVFLGLHLLVTDPSTSPRKGLGKVLFGAMYGMGVFALYEILGRLGAPSFYDKLLLVPPLNLTVQFLDRIKIGWFPSWSPRRANFAHMVVWILLFTVMISTGFVGSRHPGADPDFWLRSCEDERRGACQTWTRTLGISCQHQSGRACLSLGMALTEGRLVSRDLTEAGKNFARACDLGTPNACASLVLLTRKEGPEVFRRACEQRGDGESCFFLASLYYAGQGVPNDPAHAVALFKESCASGWSRGCGGLAECLRAGRGIEPDRAAAIEYFEKACRAGVAASCYSAGEMYRDRKAEALAQERFRQACDVSTRNSALSAAYFRPGASVPSGTNKFCR